MAKYLDNCLYYLLDLYDRQFDILEILDPVVFL